MTREPYKQKVEIVETEVKEQKGTKTEVRKTVKKELEFFTWEKLDYVDKVKKAFKIK